MTYVNIGVCSVGGVRSKKELAARGIDTMQDANRCLTEHYRAAFSEGFTVPATEPGTAFVPFIGPGPGRVHTDCAKECIKWRWSPVLPLEAPGKCTQTVMGRNLFK